MFCYTATYNPLHSSYSHNIPAGVPVSQALFHGALFSYTLSLLYMRMSYKPGGARAYSHRKNATFGLEFALFFGPPPFQLLPTNRRIFRGSLCYSITTA